MSATAHNHTNLTTPQAGSSLAFRGVSKVFETKSGEPFVAVRETSVDIAAGQFVSVVGPSGCGKSTLMLMAAGLLAPSTGGVEINGQSVTQPVTDVGIAFQDHLLLDFRTAWENVMLQAKIRKLPKQVIAQRAQELFDRLHLTKARDRYPSQLSGGMRQRVSLIRTLVHRPPLLMMDEPFGALDALTRLQVRSDLETLWINDRPSVLFITHSVEEAVGLSDRVLVMSSSPGHIVDDITIDLPRPRPIELGESREFGTYVDRIYAWFRHLGVLTHDTRGVTESHDQPAKEQAHNDSTGFDG